MFAQLTQFWTNLSSVAKVVYAAAAVMLLGAVVGVGYWSSQTQYQVLYTKLDTETAAQIVQKLKADNISYKLNGDGTTISVPVEKYHSAKMNLSVAGLPQGSGKGYELFDAMSMGTTPFVQNINSIRAIQGELQRTIMTLNPVATARVHIALPDPTPFVRDEKPVTASVTIETKPGAVLNRAATAGIVQLMTGGVKGLLAENVTILDSDGRVLSEKRDPRGNLASNDQLTHQREMEAKLVENAQEILAKLLGGPGRAVVRVTAQMSFRHLKETSEKYDPEGKVPVHELETTSKTTAVTAARGPTGAVSNIPPSPAPAASATGPNRSDESKESDYAVSRVNLSKEEQQGVIDRLTVAVILIPPKGAGDDLEESMGVTPDDVSDLVKRAIGFKEDRGDEIKVSIGKAPSEVAAEAVAVASDGPVAEPPFLFGRDFVTVVKGFSGIIAGILAMVILFKATRKRPKNAPAPGASPAFAGPNPGNQPIPDELADLHAVAATIKAWLEEPSVLRFDKTASGNAPQAKPA